LPPPMKKDHFPCPILFFLSIPFRFFLNGTAKTQPHAPPLFVQPCGPCIPSRTNPFPRSFRYVLRSPAFFHFAQLPTPLSWFLFSPPHKTLHLTYVFLFVPRNSGHAVYYCFDTLWLLTWPQPSESFFYFPIWVSTTCPCAI